MTNNYKLKITTTTGISVLVSAIYSIKIFLTGAKFLMGLFEARLSL